MKNPLGKFRQDNFLFIQILAFIMSVLCGYINATIFLRFNYGGTHQTGSLTKMALSILSLDYNVCLGLIGVVCSFFLGAFVVGMINHEDDLILKLSFGMLLLIGGVGLWGLDVIFRESQILNYYCAFYAGIQNGFFTHNKLKLRVSHMSGYFTDAGFYFGSVCRGHKKNFRKFVLYIANIVLFFVGVFLGGYLFLHVRDYVYMILAGLYVGVSIYYFALSRLFFRFSVGSKIT